VETISNAQGNVQSAWVVVKFRIQNAAGRPCLGGMAHEITEWKRAEEALRLSEQRLQAILDFSPAVIQVKDRCGHYLIVNRAWEQRFDRARRDVAGASVYDVFPEKIAGVLHANDRQVLESGKPLVVEETVLCEHGEKTYWSMKFPLLDESGEAYAV
jgi:PAS domain S-box-containing protein